MWDDLLYGAVIPVLERAVKVGISIVRKVAMRELEELEDGSDGRRARHARGRSPGRGQAQPRRTKAKSEGGSDAGPALPGTEDDNGQAHGHKDSISGRLDEI